MKKMRIMIILIVIVLVLLCLAVGFVYFGTDIFKSDKDNFYKYASQITIKDLTDEEFYSEYSDKLKTNKNQREGSIIIEGISNNTRSEIVKVNYNNKSDNQNKLEQGEITLISKAEELLKIKALRNTDLYGIIIEGILNKYIVIENNNLKEFVQKLGITDTSNIPDKIDFDNIEMTEEDKKEFKEFSKKYMSIAIEQIPKERYSKLGKELIQVDGQELNADGYKLCLTTQDIFNSCKKAIEDAKKDEALFNFFNKHYLSEQYTYEQYQNLLEQLLLSMNGEQLGEEANAELLSISVYKKGSELVKVSIDINEGNARSNISLEYNSNKIILNINKMIDSIEGENSGSRLLINIEKKSDASASNWQGTISIISQGKEEGKVTINVSRTGNITSELVQHNIVVNAVSSDGNGALITWEDKNNIVSNIEIEQFNNENHVVLNNLEAEQISTLFEQIMIKVGQKLEPLSSLISGSGLIEQSDTTQSDTKIAALKDEIIIVKADILAEKYSVGATGDVDVTPKEIADRLKETGKITEVQYQEAIQFGYITIEGDKAELGLE